LDVRRTADVGEEEDLEHGPDHDARDADPGREPVEERPEARQPADEEDAQVGRHVSARVARTRADRSIVSETPTPTRRQPTAIAAQKVRGWTMCTPIPKTNRPQRSVAAIE